MAICKHCEHGNELIFFDAELTDCTKKLGDSKRNILSMYICQNKKGDHFMHYLSHDHRCGWLSCHAENKEEQLWQQ